MNMTNMVMLSYNPIVKSVKISELKARLSAHLQLVREGEELIVCDRNKPVARIVPCQMDDYSEQEQRLITRGVMLPPRKKRRLLAWPNPPGNVPDDIIDKVWREERDDR